MGGAVSQVKLGESRGESKLQGCKKSDPAVDANTKLGEPSQLHATSLGRSWSHKKLWGQAQTWGEEKGGPHRGQHKARSACFTTWKQWDPVCLSRKHLAQGQRGNNTLSCVPNHWISSLYLSASTVPKYVQAVFLTGVNSKKVPTLPAWFVINAIPLLIRAVNNVYQCLWRAGLMLHKYHNFLCPWELEMAVSLSEFFFFFCKRQKWRGIWLPRLPPSRQFSLSVRGTSFSHSIHSASSFSFQR